jgi:hypothetical protein
MIRNRYCDDISGIEQFHLSPSRKNGVSDSVALLSVDANLGNLFRSWMVCRHCVMSCIIMDWRFGVNSGWKF